MSYGGAAIIANQERFLLEKLPIHIPQCLEVVWGLLRPKNPGAKFKTIIVCSFYSPPNKNKNSKMADHLVGVLHMLATKYPESGIILGADKNYMDIHPLLNCGLRLKQVVDKPTRKGTILDIIMMNTFSYYKTPIIVPPIQPDDPTKSKPSDHYVPVCVPHTDRHTPPIRNYRTVTYRPLPQSSIRKLGEWIVTENWEGVRGEITPTLQAGAFERILREKLDLFCPEKTVKISSQDKPWITGDLKKLHRQKCREYIKRGKSLKYKNLSNQFKEKYKLEAEKFLRKNMDNLMECKPGQAYNILKKMGAQPGDCIDANTFTLPSHESESLSDSQSAEKIANYFSRISEQFPPLDRKLLPERVQKKLESESFPPKVDTLDVYRKVKAARKPKSGVPSDLPRQIVQEFAPELATPVQYIVNSIVQSGQWPTQWKQEWVTPISKISSPETEDDLRPISLTNFFSKVTENFVVMWLLEYIGDKLDFRQYGGIRGNSVTHYLVEFINFILLNQDSTDQTAILACMVDFSKAFNRQNHNLLITKLSDMGVPSWLLKVVMAFLSNRKMVVKYKSKLSSVKDLPGGGPQGTLLGLLLFLVLINDAGFEKQMNNAGDLLTCRRNMKVVNNIHLKYVDDLTLAEAINLSKKLVRVPDNERPLPDTYHARTGHVLPSGNSQVYKQLQRTEEYARQNEMIINYEKTKLMVFNPCKMVDFRPELEVGDDQLQLVDEMKLLGVTIRSDLKWVSNTKDIVKRALNKLWIIRRLKVLGANTNELVDIYNKQCRSILEFAVPVWNGNITRNEVTDIERVQKVALHIILGYRYENYKNALEKTNLETLETRRSKLCLKFALKAEKNDKHCKWFKKRQKTATRQQSGKYWDVLARTDRLKKSPIPYFTNLLNKHYNK